MSRCRLGGGLCSGRGSRGLLGGGGGCRQRRRHGLGGGIGVSLDDTKQAGNVLIFTLQGLGGSDVSGENAVAELGGESVEGIVNGGRIDTVQHVLQRLTGCQGSIKGGFLSEDEGEEHRRHEQQQNIGAQHGDGG